MQSIDTVLETVRQQYAAGLEQASAAARGQVAARLNQFLRRLRQYVSEAEFARALVDGTTLFASAAAFFAVEGQTLSLRAGIGLEVETGLQFPLETGRAFAHAVGGRELVVALRSVGEVGEALAAASSGERAVIVPIENAERVAAVLFAGGAVDAEGVELLAGLASLVLARKGKETGLAELRVKSSPQEANFPAWGALNEEQRNLHWRAQRFARVKVSEWVLMKPEASRAGLEQNDIYLFLKKEIDAARESFRHQFMNDRSMVDYLHLELVSAAAEGDEAKLGSEYPGPLV